MSDAVKKEKVREAKGPFFNDVNVFLTLWV
jgi:hypothetical protein